ncbi:hypothetical protein Cantr_09837 [Candida viswanathii]|uniref:Uncharacterized protein n=1 Tax=Candida viswanathii TaxID=5486 RepID=A0A367YBN2_9ASCO|nr:hypothetical protein Cantr_09837 [Candida viswanathii]
MKGLLIVVCVANLMAAKLIELPRPVQSNKQIKQQGRIQYFLDDTTNDHLTYRTFTTETAFIGSAYFQKSPRNNSLIHINQTNTTYIYTPSASTSINTTSEELTELKFESFNYVERRVPVSGCMRKTNGTTSITLIRSLGAGMIFFPSDFFIGGNYYILAASIDWGKNGLSVVGYTSLTVTCRSDVDGIVQMFRKLKMVKLGSKMRKVGVDKKKKKVVVLGRWKEVLGNVKRKELGVLVFDMNLDQEMPYCESRKEYLRCNVLE